jgi:hypothetical protein
VRSQLNAKSFGGLKLCRAAQADRLRSMRSNYWWFAAAMLTVTLAACYEWVPDYEMPACRSRIVDVPPRGGPALERMPRVEARAPAVLPAPVGRVRTAGTGVSTARVRLTADGVSQEVVTDSAGWFTLVGVPAGRYRLTANQVGFRSTWDSVTVPWDAATVLGVSLESIPLDGPCSGFSAVRVRRPWWKVWKRW